MSLKKTHIVLWLFVIVILSGFMTGCSRQDKVLSEKIKIKTNFCNTQNSTFFCFEDDIFVRNTGYQYRGGKFCLSEKKLTDYLPEEDRKELSALLENGVEGTVLQSDNILIYSRKQKSGEYKITCVEFPTGMVKGNYVLPSRVECVYEDKLYYMPERVNATGETYYTIEYLDCADSTNRVVYTSDDALGQMMIREDGSIAFATYEDGYFIVDREGNIEKLHEAIKERDRDAKELFERFDNTGLYFWIEYYNHATELIKITEDGSLSRIRSEALYNEVVIDDGIIFFEGCVAKLYPYQYETLLVDRLPSREERVWNSPLEEYQILDVSYQEEGYTLIDYVYRDNTIWWLCKKDDTIIVTKIRFE